MENRGEEIFARQSGDLRKRCNNRVLLLRASCTTSGLRAAVFPKRFAEVGVAGTLGRRTREHGKEWVVSQRTKFLAGETEEQAFRGFTPATMSVSPLPPLREMLDSPAGSSAIRSGTFSVVSKYDTSDHYLRLPLVSRKSRIRSNSLEEIDPANAGMLSPPLLMRMIRSARVRSLPIVDRSGPRCPP